MKFFNLFKKELKELVNMQMILGLIISCSVFVMMGQFMSNTMNKIEESNGEIRLFDNDDTEFTQSLIKAIEGAGTKVIKVDVPNEDRAKALEDLDISNLIIIPQGFTENVLENKEMSDIEFVSAISSTSLASQMSSMSYSTVVSIIQTAVKQTLLLEKYEFTSEELMHIEAPIKLNEVTVVKNKFADISASSLMGFIQSQGILIPMVVFIILVYSSQMIVAAISTEKIDKTLETLLSAPVSRLSVVFAKMLAAAVVALISSGVYMFGFGSYMGSMMGNVNSGEVASMVGEAMSTNEALTYLGLELSAGSYVLIGLQMFMTILIGLSVSMMLGAMVDNVKSAQTIIFPVMITAMAPFIATLFADVSELSIFVKILLYIIPFTHTFMSSSNLIFGNYSAFWFGLLYQFVFFAICMILVLKLFTSDKIFTISLNFGQKKKMKIHK